MVLPVESAPRLGHHGRCWVHLKSRARCPSPQPDSGPALRGTVLHPSFPARLPCPSSALPLEMTRSQQISCWGQGSALASPITSWTGSCDSQTHRWTGPSPILPRTGATWCSAGSETGSPDRRGDGQGPGHTLLLHSLAARPWDVTWSLTSVSLSVNQAGQQHHWPREPDKVRTTPLKHPFRAGMPALVFFRRR